jgi:hypothetical protein
MNDQVRALFEACTGFVATGDGEPVCAQCGWLDHEHGADAEVRVLPARPVHRTPKRLAS